MAYQFDIELNRSIWSSDDRTAIVGKHTTRIDLTNTDDPTGFGHEVTLLVQKHEWNGTPVGQPKALTGWTSWETGHKFEMVLDSQNGYRSLGCYTVIGVIKGGLADLPANAPKKVDGYFFD